MLDKIGRSKSALIIAATMMAAASTASAQSALRVPAGVVPPPLSHARAEYFKHHPAAWTDFLAHLPRMGAGGSGAPMFKGASGSWATVTSAPAAGLSNPLLLTDGTVLVHASQSSAWYKLTPDVKGNYAAGAWSQVASLPVIGGVAYAPLYFASAVLPDGRVIIMGGEYNGGSAVWTNLGAIYDPVTNLWTAVPAPTGWTEIGDAQSVVLPNGTFMLGACCSGPAADALLNPTNLTWTSTGAPNAGGNYQDEQGFGLLPSGNVLTIDIWTNYGSGGNATNAEQYSPITGVWTSAGNTPVSLPDPYVCGTFEIGPTVLRGNNTVVAFGGNTGCPAAGSTPDPTAIYSTRTGVWSVGPNMPDLCGSGGATHCTLADAPAALEPNGKILAAASAGFAGFPTHFFEYSLGDTISQASDTVLNSGTSSSYYYNFLVLPNGQILSTDFSSTPEVYTPSGTPHAAWAPTIRHVAATLRRGTTYTVSGHGLNGVSQGGNYGDDAQSSTNYPIVKVVSAATGDVAYGRSFNFLQSGVKPGSASTAQFVLPAGAEAGLSSFYVVANGIASLPVSVTVK